ADRQIEIIGLGAVADEVADDLDTYFTLYYTNYVKAGLMTEMQTEKLIQLADLLKGRDDDFWDDLKLPTNPYWELIRRYAKEILVLLNMDDLTLEIERTEKYTTSTDGQRLL